MLAQSMLPLPRMVPVRLRSVRRPFVPSPCAGSYRLPHDVRDRLTSTLASFRNREAAFALALFISRFWSAPGRISTMFPIDRRALADHRDLGLSEGRVRGALRVLEEIGFLDRAVTSGSPYQPTPDGLRRKPILYMFGSDFAPLFIAANRRAAAARGWQKQRRVVAALDTARRPPTALPVARLPKLPKSKSEAVPVVLMGQIAACLPQPTQPHSGIEAALDRWRKAFDESRST